MKTFISLLAPCVIFACAPNQPVARVAPEDVQRFEVSVQPRLASQCGVSAYRERENFEAAKTETLDKLADCLTRGDLKGQGIVVAGATDPRGRAAYNKQLGKTRADTVASYLESKGVPPNMITTVSRGESSAEGTSEQSYADDRKVEIGLP